MNEGLNIEHHVGLKNKKNKSLLGLAQFDVNDWNPLSSEFEVEDARE